MSGGATTARFGTASGDKVVIGGGSGKLDVGTVDPVYNINGEKYATYLSGMTGQKEETTGVIKIENSNCEIKNNFQEKTCEYEINFSKLNKGSDLWLFYNVTDFGRDFDKLIILLTPNFDGKVWYEKDSNNNVIKFYSDKTGEISYRLTAPRFDWEKWGNINYDENIEGLKVEAKN